MNIKEYFDVSEIKGQFQRAVAAETAKALMQFCEQEQEFLQAIEQSEKSFQQCLDSIVKNVRSMSDIEVYTKAVKFYFSTAVVHFHMTVDLSGDNGYTAPPITMKRYKSQNSLSVSLDELLDF